MDSQIVAVYCLVDDILKTLHHRDDPQCCMTDAEVMTTAIVAALLFWWELGESRAHLLQEYGYIPQYAV